jgi:hypothetical protein
MSKPVNEVTFQSKRIEEIISLVRTSGRGAYKRAYKTNTPDNDIVFRVISHVDIGSELKDEFPGWKAGLNEQLV